MYFMTILIVSSQIWNVINCPTVRSKDCALAAKKPSRDIRNKVKSPYKYFRRILQEGPKLQLEPKREEEVNNNGAKLAGRQDDATTPTTTTGYWNQTHERCDFERIRCLRAYATGAVCARTFYYNYHSYPNFCTMDFHNCISRYQDVWMVAYMGICTELDIEKQLYVGMSYDQMMNHTFLQQMYIADSGDITN